MAIPIPHKRILPPSGEGLVWQGSPSWIILFLPLLIGFIAFLFIIPGILVRNWITLVIGGILLLSSFIISQRFANYSGSRNFSELLFTKYQLTDQRIIVTTGLWGREVKETDLLNFYDTSVSQPMFLRSLNLGNVSLEIKNGFPVQLMLIKDPIIIKEIARNAILTRRKESEVIYHRIV